MDPAPKQKDPLSLRLEGRAGKTVTLVLGLQMHPQGKLDLLHRLKRACAAGGALKNGVPELQGDHRERLKGLLEPLGYRVRVL